MSGVRPVIRNCEIVGTKNIDDNVYYVIRVTTQDNTVWCTLKRYSHFEEFHYLLLDTVSEQSLTPGIGLPGKRFKWWNTHVSPNFVEERSIILENYLQKICQIPELSSSELFVGFVASDRQNIIVPPKVTPRQLLQNTEFPDDVEVTDVSISTYRLMSDHVLYQVDVCNMHNSKSFQKWTVLKRFTQFLEMDEQLREYFANNHEVLAALPSPPEKYSKLFHDHNDVHFIAHRQILLDNYLVKLMLIRQVLLNHHFLAFLGVRS